MAPRSLELLSRLHPRVVSVCQLGVLHPKAKGTSGGRFAVRGVLLVDPTGTVQLTMMYPTSTGSHGCVGLSHPPVLLTCCVCSCRHANTGRNFPELLRCLDALQVAAKHEVCPFATAVLHKRL
jgi:alkyl hydroperoxide reductase subunit AhpC